MGKQSKLRSGTRPDRSGTEPSLVRKYSTITRAYILNHHWCVSIQPFLGQEVRKQKCSSTVWFSCTRILWGWWVLVSCQILCAATCSLEVAHTLPSRSVTWCYHFVITCSKYRGGGVPVVFCTIKWSKSVNMGSCTQENWANFLLFERKQFIYAGWGLYVHGFRVSLFPW